MIRRSTWIALIVFVVALAGAIWYARSGGSSAQSADATPTAAPLWSFASRDIMSMKIEDLETGDIVQAHRNASPGWVLDQPKDLADVGRLEIAADTLASLVPSDSSPDADLAAFGLDNPSYRISVSLRDGSSDQLLVGQTSPTGDVVYVKLPSSGTVYFVSSYTLGNVTAMTGDPPIATPTPRPTLTPPALTLPTPTP
jgi:hypothetical protein